jgi:cytochrome c
MSDMLRLTGLVRGVYLGLYLAALVQLCSCGRSTDRQAAALTGGDPARGKAAISRYGCASCHTIAGVRGADGLVGPPLTGVASRVYIAGVLQNTPENLMQWIQDPPRVDQKTAMPKLGVTEADARDIAGYLYTLK